MSGCARSSALSRRALAGQDVVRPFSSPIHGQGHLAVLRGNLAEEGAVAKLAGLKHHGRRPEREGVEAELVS
jgi:dihydroxyacid dehydratase/phosphogluconate dehydratase